MSNFEFTFVVEGFEIALDEQLDALYLTFDEVTASHTAGKTELTFVVEAENAMAALESTFVRLRDILPNVRVLYLDEDLVAIPDIAARTSRSPESIRLLANGQRGLGEFPIPVGVLGGGTRIWKWADVSQWLKNHVVDYNSDSEFVGWEATVWFHALLAHHYVTT